MPLLLVSDANIFIDLEAGDLIELLFRLPYRIQTPDLLYADELAREHPTLPAMGLEIAELGPEGIEHLSNLIHAHPEISRYDAAALVLAKEEPCPLLTGDSRLREAARHEGVEVHGTLWVVESLIQANLLTVEGARASYQSMWEANRRLPWDQAERRLRRLRRPS